MDEPTRHSLSATPHTLDLVFTSEENMVTNLYYLPGLGNSDHACLRFNLICYTQHYIQSSHHYNFNQADFLGMRDWLSSFDWAADFDSTDVSSMWNCFADRFTEALNKFVPISKPRKYKNIFMTREAFNLRKKRIVCGKNTVHQDHLLIIFPIYRLAMH